MPTCISNVIPKARFDKIVIASRNLGKIQEIQSMLADLNINFISLNDYKEIKEPVEDGRNYLENALKKARTVAESTGEMALADDSGLEVDALGGAPGIRSARYAGHDADDVKNIQKLLDGLKGIPLGNRRATFRCVVVLYHVNGFYDSFEGRWSGLIAEQPVGRGGFGYDPVFFLPIENMTVAELAPEIKNKISHRAQAIAKLKERLLKG